MVTPGSILPSRVDKLLVPARVMVPGPEQIAGSFAVSAHSPFRDGPESLLELLNAPARVLPFIRTADEMVMLLARLAIDWVEVDARVESTWVRPASYLVTREERVQVRLLDGRKIDGLVSMELPEHLNRISDFLNLDDDFFPLTLRDRTVLINKSRVQGLRLFESSPRPAGEIEDLGAA